MPKSPAQIYALADAAGRAAAEAHNPTPMHVVERENPFDDKSRITKRYAPVMDGACGFAWINVPGNSAFGRYAKAHGHRKGYPQGINIWVSGYGQSYERKMAYARAFAGVLQAEGVERAYASGRLD